MKLADYTLKHTSKTPCKCGNCIPDTQNEHKCNCQKFDIEFFTVHIENNPQKKEFKKLVKEEFPHWLNGKEHSYIETGTDIGDQGIALQVMSLGHILGIWKCLTPTAMLGDLIPKEIRMNMAGSGMITIISS